MTMTTRVQSVSVPVSDQDAAISFYTETLGCELTLDKEIWPGARLVIVTPPGSDVAILLLPADSQIPVAVRLGTSDAEAAHARVRDSAATLENDKVLHLPGNNPMFAFADPDGNRLVYLQESAG